MSACFFVSVYPSRSSQIWATRYLISSAVDSSLYSSGCLSACPTLYECPSRRLPDSHAQGSGSAPSPPSLQAGKKFRVVVLDSRPLLEGRALLRRLLAAGLAVTYCLLNALAYILKEVTKVRTAHRHRVRGRKAVAMPCDSTGLGTQMHLWSYTKTLIRWERGIAEGCSQLELAGFGAVQKMACIGVRRVECKTFSGVAISIWELLVPTWFGSNRSGSSIRFDSSMFNLVPSTFRNSRHSSGGKKERHPQ